jgi:predicted site-specific integrase-resolvase
MHIFKTGEVAKIFGVRIETVQRWITERRIDAVKQPNGRWGVPGVEVDRFLKLRKVNFD